MINIFLAINLETTPEILIFSAMLGGMLMIFSRIWNQRIFSILACGVWLYLMIELKDEPSMILTLIGLMFVELYHAFISRAGLE